MTESFQASRPVPQPEPGDVSETKHRAISARIFGAALFLGLALRLVAAFWGDIGPGGDGVQRLANAVKWAANPQWEGFSGVWPPSHWYFLGALIRIWDQPILLAKGVNLLCGIGAVIVLAKATRPLFGDLVASVSALLLAIFWTHIWLTTAYWVELPYLLLVFLAVHYATRVLVLDEAAKEVDKKKPAEAQKNALRAGVFLALAMLLRHEGLILFGLFSLWFLFNVKRLPLIVTFAALPICVAIVHFAEPWSQGHSYFEFAAYIKGAKASENLVQGFTLIDCLKQWILIPASEPSLLVVIPGFYGLWKARHLAKRDLFAWMFLAQVLFYLAMTLMSGWRPQLRYVMLYFVNLLPYAALSWVQLMQKFPRRPVLTTLVALTLILQSAGWWIGRNEKRPWGWLPVQIASSSQIALDNWVLQLQKQQHDKVTIAAITPGSLSDGWSMNHSMLVNNVSPREITLIEAYVPEVPGMLEGKLPDSVAAADAILVDPNALFYAQVLRSIERLQPPLKMVIISPHVTAFLKPRLLKANAQ